MKRFGLALLALLLVLGAALWFAPARLASRALADSPVRLLQPTGTLWRGAADVLIEKEPIGRLHWQFSPTATIGGALAGDWQLKAAEHALQGHISARPDRIDLTGVSGEVQASVLRRFLGVYDIFPTGDLSIDQIDITDLQLTDKGQLLSVSAVGDLRWAGGAVTYTLGGQTHDVALPPLHAQISTPQDWPQMLVTGDGDDLPLITGRLTERNSVSVGITRGFTKLVNQPWPGSEPDHVVVLEVEEMLN